MKNRRLILLTTLALTAFAGNSILCRFALKETAIDPATFTSVRIVAGATVLCLLAMARKGKQAREGGWLSAMALFAYAAGFSFAYTQLSAGIGALLLFGAVQATMIICGLFHGERLPPAGSIGLVIAIGGLVGLTWPGVTTPPALASASMLGAGMAWGVYSLRGRSVAHPLGATAENFLRALPLTILLSGLLWSRMRLDRAGVIAAFLSGAVTSGLGYVIWYAVVPDLGAIRASIVQLCVPVLAAGAGMVLLSETLSTRVALAATAILGGVALALFRKSATHEKAPPLPAIR